MKAIAEVNAVRLDTKQVTLDCPGLLKAPPHPDDTVVLPAV